MNITSYLEPDTSADNGTLAYVNIHSRYRQMIWDEMEVQKVSPVRICLTELENSIVSLRLEYEVIHVNDKRETERYQIQESYRVRYTEQRMYLLNYERTADRIFDPDLDIFSEKAIDLGILNTEVEYQKMKKRISLHLFKTEISGAMMWLRISCPMYSGSGMERI